MCVCIYFSHCNTIRHEQITVGRPRPDMLDRCQPPPGIQNPPLQLLNYTICTADHNTYEFKDGFKSFPSGHASCMASILATSIMSNSNLATITASFFCWLGLCSLLSCRKNAPIRRRRSMLTASTFCTLCGFSPAFPFV